MKYTLLLKQHIGAPCSPVLPVGSRVCKGTLLAVPTGLGAPLHSSVDGILTEITDTALIIEASESQSDTFLSLEPGSDEELLKASGLVGMGGAGFPTSVKCHIDLKGGFILVNAAECEPLLEHNIHQLEQNAEKTMDGLKRIMKLCNARKGIFAIKEKHAGAVGILKKLCENEPDISFHLLPDLYPMGEERAVVREVLGPLLKPTELPSAADAVVINVETVLRAAEAMIDRRPCISKNVSVAGKLKGGTHTRVFFDVPLGTTVGHLIEQAGGIDGEYGEIIMGGPFTGHAVSLDTPITKTTGGIIVTAPFENLNHAKTGLLLCACGGNQARMEDIAAKMNGDVVLIQKCKQAADIKGTLKCENPGNCPGQAQKCLNFKKAGCTDIIIGNCSDCTNTVMGSAPKLGLRVHHQTDHVFDTVSKERMRYLTTSKTCGTTQDEQEKAGMKDMPKPVKMHKTNDIQNQAEAQNSADMPKTADTQKTAEVQDPANITIENNVLRIDIEEGRDIHIEFPVFF
ncbi:MAG: proline reductase-associated electron transfer protein PrdC [Lachnospiraceae bacterium]|nr:proline reductase-associated electron transfer protein PrdC [Lachnospiraceae bacterium]